MFSLSREKPPQCIDHRYNCLYENEARERFHVPPTLSREGETIAKHTQDSTDTWEVLGYVSKHGGGECQLLCGGEIHARRVSLNPEIW
jgi:hypothetical protein